MSVATPAATAITMPLTPTAPQASAHWMSVVQRHCVWPRPAKVKPPSTQPRNCSQPIQARGAAAASGQPQRCTSRRVVQMNSGR